MKTKKPSKKEKIKQIEESIGYNIVLAQKTEFDFRKNMLYLKEQLDVLLVQLVAELKKK